MCVCVCVRERERERERERSLDSQDLLPSLDVIQFMIWRLGLVFWVLGFGFWDLGLGFRVSGLGVEKIVQILSQGRCRANMAHIRQSRPWLSGKSTYKCLSCALFARKRRVSSST